MLAQVAERHAQVEAQSQPQVLGVATLRQVRQGIERQVKVGDVIIIPPGVVHGWSNIPDHVDYLSFRPSQNLLQPGWVNPTLAK